MTVLIDKPQIKICGITNVADALLCLNAGVHALGFIFAESPRQISALAADKIIAALPATAVRKVGIFVNEDFANIMQHVRMANLDAVQLHGDESNELIVRLQDQGLHVVKVLFQKRAPFIQSLTDYTPDAFLLESDNQPETLANMQKHLASRPFILAGGLNAANLQQVTQTLSPSAIDLNTGSEQAYGIKSAAKIKAIMQIINNIKYNQPVRRAF